MTQMWTQLTTVTMRTRSCLELQMDEEPCGLMRGHSSSLRLELGIQLAEDLSNHTSPSYEYAPGIQAKGIPSGPCAPHIDPSTWVQKLASLEG